MRHLLFVALAGTLSLAAAEPAPPVGTRLFLGANLTDGNSETTVFNAEIQRDGVCPFGNDYSVGASYNYGEASGDTTVENARGHLGLRRLLADPLYAYLKSDVLTDDIAGIDYRFTVGPGLGTFLLRGAKAELAAEAGATWVKEKVVSLVPHAAGDGTPSAREESVEDDYFALRVAQTYKRALSETSRVWQSVEWLPEFSDFGNYLLNAELGIEADVTAGVSLRLLVKDAYDREPATGREKNDVSLIAGLGVRL
jgi:putative salt-induced outer membrane protein YdiY